MSQTLNALFDGLWRYAFPSRHLPNAQVVKNTFDDAHIRIRTEPAEPIFGQLLGATAAEFAEHASLTMMESNISVILGAVTQLAAPLVRTHSQRPSIQPRRGFLTTVPSRTRYAKTLAQAFSHVENSFALARTMGCLRRQNGGIPRASSACCTPTAPSTRGQASRRPSLAGLTSGDIDELFTKERKTEQASDW
jgi:hypothetical protein